MIHTRSDSRPIHVPAVLCAFRNGLFVAGGYGGGTDYLNTMESFDVEKGWIKAPDMACPRSGLGLCFGPDRCIYAVGELREVDRDGWDVTLTLTTTMPPI